MFNIGPAEFAVIALVALIVIRPKDLPAMLRKVAKAWREIKKTVDELTAMKDDFMKQVNELSKEVEDAASEIKDAVKLQDEKAAKDGKPAGAPASPQVSAYPSPAVPGPADAAPLASFDASAPDKAQGYGGAEPAPGSGPQGEPAPQGGALPEGKAGPEGNSEPGAPVWE